MKFMVQETRKLIRKDSENKLVTIQNEGEYRKHLEVNLTTLVNIEEDIKHQRNKQTNSN